MTDRPADAHCHLDQAGGTPALPPDGTVVVAVTNHPRHWARPGRAAPGQVRALGLHPHEPHRPRAVGELLAQLALAPVIGEIGLDGTPGPNTLARQQDTLGQVLAHPAARDRMLSVHSRRAVAPLLGQLRSADVPGAVLHWFTGTPRQAAAAADHGAWFSVNQSMRRKTDLLAALPRDRVLVETDAPHTGRHSRPGDLSGALAALADAWATTAGAAADQVTSNQHALRALLAHDPFSPDPTRGAA